MDTIEVIREFDHHFKYEVAERTGGENLKSCFSCATCTASCPVSEVDERYNPRKIIRMTLLGLRKEVLSSDLLWMCASCFACSARCPQNVMVADLMRVLRELAVEKGFVPAEFRKHLEYIDGLSHEVRLEMIKSLLESKNLDMKKIREKVIACIDREK